MASDSPSQPQGPSADRDDERAPGPKPLSRRASRLFVIAAILFVIAATAGSTYYLVNMTSRALNTSTDTSAVETPPPSDSASAPTDTLR